MPTPGSGTAPWSSAPPVGSPHRSGRSGRDTSGIGARVPRGQAERCGGGCAAVSNGVSNRPGIPDEQAKVGRNHNPRVGGSSPSSGMKYLQIAALNCGEITRNQFRCSRTHADTASTRALGRGPQEAEGYWRGGGLRSPWGSRGFMAPAALRSEAGRRSRRHSIPKRRARPRDAGSLLSEKRTHLGMALSVGWRSVGDGTPDEGCRAQRPRPRHDPTKSPHVALSSWRRDPGVVGHAHVADVTGLPA
jgi:hypothetical protein